MATATNPFTPLQTNTSGSGPSNATHPDTPMRIAAHTARNGVICVEVSPLHDHLFLGLRDGTIDAFDLDRLCPSPYRIPNLWWEEEEILRKSGVPDAPSRRHVPLIIDIKTHPKDINQLLLAYEGGVLLFDAKEKIVMKTFQLRHLPGAMGSAVGNPDLIWTERASPATCIAWRPDGLIFACGHEDGCISFWDLEDDSKPVMVRTLEFIDVDKPLGIPEEILGGRPAQTREPIFKVAWSGFPEQSWLDMAANATGKVQQHQQSQQQQYQQSNHVAQQELTSGSILSILGGATERHLPGIVCLHFPPFTIPYSSYWSSKTPEAILKSRQALRTSLDTTLETRYSTTSTVEDFILIPKNNPYYDLSFDPMALVILEAADPLLPPLSLPASVRGLTAYAFPPPPKSTLLPSPPPPPLSAGQQGTFAQQKLNLPIPLSTTGSGAILGAKWIEVSVQAYRKLAGKRDVAGLPNGVSITNGTTLEVAAGQQNDDKEDLILRGGLASATVSGVHDGGIRKDEIIGSMIKGEKLRILLTWHNDGTIRFHDASPQLLLIGVGEQSNKSDAAAAATTTTSTSTTTTIPESQSYLGPKYLEKAFPSPLPHLTINIRSLIQDKRMVGHPIFDHLKSNLRRLRVAEVDFAPETLETVIVLQSGQVLHYKFGYAHYSQTEEVKEAVAEEVQQEEELAAETAQHHLPLHRFPSSSLQDQYHQHRKSFSKLDGAMAGALHDLNLEASSSSSRIPPVSSFQQQEERQSPQTGSSSPRAPPPPRPKRDPKRGSVIRKLGYTRENNVDEGDTSSIISSSENHLPSTNEHSSGPSLSRPPLQGIAPLMKSTTHSMPVEEITSIGHLATWESDSFKPNILIDLQRGEVSSVSLSDVGFLAIACGLALAVVDLRGPEFIIREGFSDGMQESSRSGYRDRREERKIIEEENKSPIRKVSFSICRTANQPTLSPTLITVRDNGFVSLWTFTRSSLELWLCDRTHGSMMEELKGAIRVEVLDTAGNVCPAVPSELQRSLKEQGRGGPSSDWQQMANPTTDINLLFGVGPRTLSLRVGLSGPRLAIAQLEEDLLDACIINRRGESVCLALSNTSLRLFALPSLRLITRVPRHNRNREEQLHLSKVNITFDSNGDFIEVMNSVDVRMWTIFATLPRPGMPSLLLYQPVSMPLAPNMLNNMANSVVNWIGGKSSALTSSAQFDQAIAGTRRPPAPKLPEQKYIEVRVMQQLAKERATAALNNNADAHGGYSSTTFASTSVIPGRSYVDGLFAQKKEETKQTIRDTQDAANQASWNIDLAKQRGEMMTSLEEGLSSLEKGAKTWMQSTKEDFIKQTAKDKLSKFF